jgi:hypothetical protein
MAASSLNGEALMTSTAAERGSVPFPDPAMQALLKDPVQRRWWLLQRAMDGVPLNTALQIAAQAEAFVLGQRANSSETPASKAPTPGSPRDDTLCTTAPAPARPELDKTQSSAGALETLLPPDRKAELLKGLASGLSNAEIAAAFGLTPRQVQGFRMQLARAANRREQAKAEKEDNAQSIETCNSPLVEEVIRYLRQQGDVVVKSGHFAFLVNNRFTLDFEQLLTRANRMRSRQGKSEFGANSASIG